MSIIWKYLDKRSATVAAIKDYSSMEFIINHTDEEITAERLKADGVGSPNWDGMPHTHNPQAGEERILNMIAEIDVLKERYRQAVEYMEWFRPAWEELSEDELDVYKRGRNTNTHSKAKNATMGQYRKATGLEALYGYLYLKGDMERLQYFVDGMIRQYLAGKEQ